jgi:hypothetical protein
MYDAPMGADLERQSRRTLAIGVLFAAVGILALVIAVMQPAPVDPRERSAGDVFNARYVVEEKAEVLATVSANASSSSESSLTEDEKLRLLQAIAEQPPL